MHGHYASCAYLLCKLNQHSHHFLQLAFDLSLSRRDYNYLGYAYVDDENKEGTRKQEMLIE